MNTINVVILGDRMVASTNIAGFTMDNIASALNIEIPQEMRSLSFRLKFKTESQSPGYAYISDVLSMQEDGTLNFPLPSGLMEEGKLLVQLEGRNAASEEVVHKSILELCVKPSLGTELTEEGLPPNYAGLLDDTLDRINDEITTQAEIVQEKAEEATTAAQIATSKAEEAADSAASAASDADRAKEEADRAQNAATVSVGNVTTGAPGSQASVTNSGTASAAVLDFVIPRGDQGPAGPQGPEGPQGNNGVVTQLDPGMFGMHVDEDGHLILTHNDNEPAPPLSIQDGRLIYSID